MYLHDLESSKNKRRKRVGRGPGSGSGKTADVDKTVRNHDPAIKGNEDLKVDKIHSTVDCLNLDLQVLTRCMLS